MFSPLSLISLPFSFLSDLSNEPLLHVSFLAIPFHMPVSSPTSQNCSCFVFFFFPSFVQFHLSFVSGACFFTPCPFFSFTSYSYSEHSFCSYFYRTNKNSNIPHNAQTIIWEPQVARIPLSHHRISFFFFSFWWALPFNPGYVIGLLSCV